MRQVRAHASSACRSLQAALRLSSRYRIKRDRTYNAAEPIASGVVPGFERSLAILSGPPIAVGGSPHFFRRFLRFWPSRSPRRARKRPFPGTLS